MTPEEQLREELKRDYPGSTIIMEASSSGYFEVLQRRFPVCGSKIDWDKVPAARVCRVDTANSEQYFDEADAKDIMPKHAYMIKENEGEQVKLYDTSGRREVIVTVTHLTKYFSSLVAAEI